MDTPERKLFVKVMEQAIRDVTYEGDNPVLIEERIETEEWFREGGSEFRKVCDYAGLDPDAVHGRYIAGGLDRNMIERKHDPASGNID